VVSFLSQASGTIPPQCRPLIPNTLTALSLSLARQNRLAGRHSIHPIISGKSKSSIF
jgi:hypothetical protein